MDGFIDITLPVKTNQVQYPGEERCRVTPVMQIKNGDQFNVTRLDMSAHTGTHMDAPYHYIDGGEKIHELDTHHFIGRARVFDLSNVTGMIEKKHIASKPIEEGDIILIKTKNSRYVTRDEFMTDYVFLSGGAAEYLAGKGIVTLGFDYLSIDAFNDPEYPAHRALLGRGIVIIEGLDLSGIGEGIHDIVALPMKILNAALP